MIKALIDTNVLLDHFVGNRDPEGYSGLILAAARSHKIEAVITSQSILDAAYVATGSRGAGLDCFKKTMLSIFNYVNVSHIDLFEIREALLSPDTDVEDNAQYAHALSEACDVIITNDRKFIQRKTPGEILMMTPEEFVGKMSPPTA